MTKEEKELAIVKAKAEVYDAMAIKEQATAALQRALAKVQDIGNLPVDLPPADNPEATT